MRPTKDLLARGQTCTECHVGIGSTDVNHDLIAAGHPRLNFEYGSQLAKLPKHWRVDDDKARHPDYEAKVWALGQLLAAKASLDLLESRAPRSLPDDSTVPWPEFAEYSCFSCHHELAADGLARRRTPRRPPSRAPSSGGPGTLPLAKGLPSGSRASTRTTRSRPSGCSGTRWPARSPTRPMVAQRARAASDELGRMADSLNRGRIAPREVRSMLARRPQGRRSPDEPLDWDRAARQYLAIVALDKAAGRVRPAILGPRVRASLDRLLKDLDLPLQRRAPRAGSSTARIGSTPRRIKDDLRIRPGRPPQTREGLRHDEVVVVEAVADGPGGGRRGARRAGGPARPGLSAEPRRRRRAGQKFLYFGSKSCESCHAVDQGESRTPSRLHGPYIKFDEFHHLEHGGQAFARLRPAQQRPRGRRMASLLKIDVTKREAGCLGCHSAGNRRRLEQPARATSSTPTRA